MSDFNKPVAYDIADFITAFSVSRAHIYRLINAGKLKAVKTGRKILIPAASAEEWFASLQPISCGSDPVGSSRS